jgi:2-polyprenyl-3-methyl-5-hydroxy-6-metoxy-1,4-benzoquinol methylase
MIYAFTSAALNYLPKARLCLSSLRRFHPEFRLVYALADRLPIGTCLSEACIDEMLPVEDLGPPVSRSWIFQHSIVELSTGIKPFVLQALLERPDCEAVLYFDPDIVLFSRLDEVLDAARTSDIVLTPHQLDPDSRIEAIVDNEIGSLKYGIYNFGFFGVRNSPEGRRFAKWWGDRLFLFCQERLDLGLWTDQKWINHVPVFFDDVATLKEPRLNVAPWNLTTRAVAGESVESTTVAGRPLGFYHFTGFDSGAHEIMAAKYGGENPAVMRLVEWYQHAIRHTDNDALAKITWSYGRYSDGTAIAAAHRELYRHRRDLQAAYPDPFDGKSDSGAGAAAGSYLGWLQHTGEFERLQRTITLPVRVAELERECAQLRGQIRELKDSLSWRITRPVRLMAGRKKRPGRASRPKLAQMEKPGEPPADWSIDLIQDQGFAARFTTVVDILEDWTAAYGGFAGKHVLDFGCGEGITALSLALRYPDATVLGTDIMPDIERCLPTARDQIGLMYLPGNLSLRQVQPDQPIVAEQPFDIIYSWSVIEHVDRRLLADTFRRFHDALRPGGYLFTQIDPLYYSSEGSHLFAWVPERWGHLVNQDDVYIEKLRANCRSDEEHRHLVGTYRTLNRLTTQELREVVTGTNFRIVREYVTAEDFLIPAPLLGCYKEDALRTNQIVILALRSEYSIGI